MFVFAQLSTSVSDDQIRLIIIALLVVALLLAALTIWYFVKTSPSRRVRAAQARRQAPASRQGAAGATATAGSRQNAPTTAAPTATVSTDADGDDEWDRLTAPQPRRPTSG